MIKMALVEKRILIANIFGIGDVLFTTPLIASLKKEISGVSVDCVCNARTKAILQTQSFRFSSSFKILILFLSAQAFNAFSKSRIIAPVSI